MEDMKKIFSEVVLEHLTENYPNIKFKAINGEIFNNDVWVVNSTHENVYAYLTYFNHTTWCAKVLKRLKNKDILLDQLNLLGFEASADLG